MSSMCEKERVLLLDYDGTLHETLPIYAPAFRKAYRMLEERGEVEARNFSDEEIGRWLGYSSRAMWDAFAPDLAEASKAECSKLIGEEMVRLIEAGQARLYPGAIETLASLRDAGIQLIYLSNSKRAYMNAHRRAFGLDSYFTDFFCCEDYDFRPKTEIFPEIQKKYPGRYVVAGDRFHDLEVGEKFRLPTIGCLYGYACPGELMRADFFCEKVSQLPETAEEAFAY